MSETILRIVDWDELFENNRTRTMKTMQWVPLPNKHDGDGYTELLDHPDGPLHYACWVTVTQVASRCHPRGTLLRSTGKAHDSASLSRITRIPVPAFDSAIPRLLLIGWLERISSDGKVLERACQEGVRRVTGACQDGDISRAARPRARRTERKGREGKGKEGKKEDSSEPQAASEPAVLVFPIVGKGEKTWDLTQQLVDSFGEAFPDLDVMAELRESLSWCNCNKQKRKTVHGMPKFLNTWLSTSQNRGHGGGQAKPIQRGSLSAGLDLELPKR